MKANGNEIMMSQKIEVSLEQETVWVMIEEKSELCSTIKAVEVK